MADGTVTSFSDNGGPVLTHPVIVLIFWGSAWADSRTSPTQAQFTTALTDIVNGPWATQLSQYRGIANLNFERAIAVTNSDPQTSFTDPQIVTFLTGLFDNGTLPKPSATQHIYCVLMPTGHSSSDNAGDVGQHQNFSYNGTDVVWAWVTNDGTLTGGNSIPKVFSHEVAEACSDPHGDAIIVNGNSEIGDVCNNTWATVDGHAEEAYWSQADKRCVIPAAAAYPAVRGNPSLIQGRFGTKGNFELVVPTGAGLIHTWRDNDNTFLPWRFVTPFGQALGAVDAVSMIESNFGSPGNLELVARAGANLSFLWRDVNGWQGPFALEANVAGVPALIQSRFGTKGNFELIVPSASAGIVHYWRNNDAAGLPWSGPTPFGQAMGQVDAVSMIESNFGSPGNLEVVARAGANLSFLWRDVNGWHGPFPLEAGVRGNPVLIQSRFGTKGNFELVVPAAGGGLVHYWRNNDAAGLPWSGPTPFGQAMGPVDAVSMIESNFASPGNLEVVALTGSTLQFLWRDVNGWHGPFPMESITW